MNAYELVQKDLMSTKEEGNKKEMEHEDSEDSLNQRSRSELTHTKTRYNTTMSIARSFLHKLQRQ